MINNPVAGSINCFGNGSVSQSSHPDKLAGPSETGGNNTCFAFVFIAPYISPPANIVRRLKIVLQIVLL
jgi:hypothetical protein